MSYTSDNISESLSVVAVQAFFTLQIYLFQILVIFANGKGFLILESCLQILLSRIRCLQTRSDVLFNN